MQICPPPSTQRPQSPAGVLLVGHGSRDAVGTAEFLETAGMLSRRMPHLPLEACFLELAAPSIEMGVDRLIRRGARHLVVLPALLFAAGHVNRDIPEAVKKAIGASEHGGDSRRRASLSWEQAGHFGRHPAILQASWMRDREVTGNQQIGDGRNTEEINAAPESWRRLLVGRGSGDVAATQEMMDFSRLRSEAWRLNAEVCFLAIAEPALPAALARLAGANPRRVLVQPHLLFAGALMAEIHEQVANVAKSAPGAEWRVARPLGATELVVDALYDRLAETSIGASLRGACSSGARAIGLAAGSLELVPADLARSRTAGYDLK